MRRSSSATDRLTGVSADGSPDPGVAHPRAGSGRALVGLFTPRADRHDAAILPTPAHLFASEVGPHSHSQRPLETLLPLTSDWACRSTSRFFRGRPGQLVEAIRACNGDVLVAWEHSRLPLHRHPTRRRRVERASALARRPLRLVWVFEPGPTTGGWHLRPGAPAATGWGPRRAHRVGASTR